jgi:hypothetical protein
MGGVPVGMEVLQPQDTRWVYSSTSSQIYKDLRKNADPTKLHSTLNLGEAAITSAQNEIVYLTPEQHSIATAITWDGSYTHLIGMTKPSYFYSGVYPEIKASANMSPMITVSGNGCYFANFTLNYGRGYSTNPVGLKVTGGGNTFEGIHFDGPQNATEAASQYSIMVWNQGDGTVFKNCSFGCHWQSMTQGYLMQFGHGASAPTTVFEECIFLMNAGATTPYFMRIQPDTSTGILVFKGCQFINIGSSSLTYAIDGVGLGDTKMFFDANCSFAGVTDIVTANMETKVYCSTANLAGTASVATNGVKLANLIATNPDVS